jgi:hypothetical protein
MLWGLGQQHYVGYAGLKWTFFNLHPLLVGYETHNQCKMISRSKTCHGGTFLIVFGPRMDFILFIVQMNVL